MKEGVWERIRGIELEGRVLGLIGCGQIGQHVALLSLGFGMRVLAYRRNPDPSFSPSEEFQYVSLNELLPQSDIISLHRPAPLSGKPFIAAEVMKKMKKGVYLINTARASLIDEKAVLEALGNGHVAGLATDAYAKEPPSDFRLVKHDRVIALPHVGGFTGESVLRATSQAVDNLINNL